MHVDTDDLATLLKMQHLTWKPCATRRSSKSFPSAVILEARSKKKAIGAEVSPARRAPCESRRAAFAYRRRGSLASEKQRQVQSEIDAVRGDYRGVEARTKHEGAQRLREAPQHAGSRPDRRRRRAGEDRRRAGAGGIGVRELERQEAEATAAFVMKEGGALKDALARIEAERAMLASSLPADLLDAYKKRPRARAAAVRGTLVRNQNCGVCRMAIIEGGRLIDMACEGPGQRGSVPLSAEGCSS